jgi:GNAT superfamily N-acetyltransferase
MSGGIKIRRATLDDVEGVVPLFDAYRQFYGQPSSLDAARVFLLDRFRGGESTLFLAEDAHGSIAGFAQLFPTFSSVALARAFVLNDLFVASARRRQGVGQALLRAAVTFCREHRAVRVTLSTQTTNAAAQALYAANGWALQTEYQVYTLKL